MWLHYCVAERNGSQTAGERSGATWNSGKAGQNAANPNKGIWLITSI